MLGVRECNSAGKTINISETRAINDNRGTLKQEERQPTLFLDTTQAQACHN